MTISEVVIKLTVGQGALLATADVIIGGDFVVHNIRIIRVTDRILVAMPSRVATAKCRCGEKNPVTASFCNQCGNRLPTPVATAESRERLKVHSDIAHPITMSARNELNRAVLEAYHAKFAQTAVHEPAREEVEQ